MSLASSAIQSIQYSIFALFHGYKFGWPKRFSGQLLRLRSAQILTPADFVFVVVRFKRFQLSYFVYFLNKFLSIRIFSTLSSFLTCEEKMSSDPLEALTNKLCNTQVCGEGVSFVGKSLKLNNADDGKSMTPTWLDLNSPALVSS